MSNKTITPTKKQIEYCDMSVMKYEDMLCAMNMEEVLNEFETLKEVMSNVFNEEEQPYFNYEDTMEHLSKLMLVVKREAFSYLYGYYKGNK